MPIYEFICQDCKKEFEKLVFNKSDCVCPHCNGTNLNRQMSTCSFKSQGSDGSVTSSAGSGCSGCGASSCAGCH